MKRLLETLVENNREITKKGNLASYIPELLNADKNDLGVAVITLDGKVHSAGDCSKKFTMQSISKVVSLILAIQDNGKERVFEKVGMEPTGDSFNSIVNLEIKQKVKPYNPMINAGAIATTALIYGVSEEEKFEKILNFTRKVTGNNDIDINKSVYKSEKLTGDRNRYLAYYLKSNNTIDGDVEDILDLYFKQCSIEVNCIDIAKFASMLANDGILPWSGERVISREVSRIVKTIMVTCGMYDASGKFAVHIGIPAKSGVGGGIMAAVPKRMGIGVYGPSLDKKGNSIAGTHILKELSDELDLSIF
ncbi:L-glutaminase [Clostridium cavendishii DSM 21758]|uniref:Glutaminase n=1 Tax=Clostridium cavendishii DSM 21758 TaxID=1121302 RepID=A0A1M6NS32_9CLOT|nr:glutaminase A [Clostridium cavendishii]SHJ98557.1 L-glutaminase [Clostridium cavendishii DSM 21758]